MDTSNFFKQFKQVLKIITTILSWTLFSILILIIAFLAYYLICTNIYASRGEKFEPKFSLYTIVSPSMEPTIKVYDVILNTRIDDPSSIKKGDVITFVSTSNISNGMTVTHRVVDIVQGKDGLEFKTKGDNNLSEDSDTAKASNVMGKVFLRLPQLGRLQFFLSSNGGWLIVVLIPALFIIVNDIFKIIKLNRTKKALDKVEEEKEKENNKKEIEDKRKEEIKNRLKLNENFNEADDVFEPVKMINSEDMPKLEEKTKEEIVEEVNETVKEAEEVITKNKKNNKITKKEIEKETEEILKELDEREITESNKTLKKVNNIRTNNNNRKKKSKSKKKKR